MTSDGAPNSTIPIVKPGGEIPDGWIAHDGGPCPVAIGTTVSVLYRNGLQATWAVSHGMGWKYLPDYLPEHDIIAYKPSDDSGGI